MASWEVIEKKFIKKVRNITFSETVSLIEHYGYSLDNKGKTSGSRIRFQMSGHPDILLHKPHPQKELKLYVINDLHDFFIQEGFINE